MRTLIALLLFSSLSYAGGLQEKIVKPTAEKVKEVRTGYEEVRKYIDDKRTFPLANGLLKVGMDVSRSELVRELDFEYTKGNTNLNVNYRTRGEFYISIRIPFGKNPKEKGYQQLKLPVREPRHTGFHP